MSSNNSKLSGKKSSKKGVWMQRIWLRRESRKRGSNDTT
jgi:hypothetical protein